MCPDGIFGIVKPQAEALGIVNITGWNPVKLVENPLFKLVRNTDTPITHLHYQSFGRIRHGNRYNRNIAGIFQRIVKLIKDDVGQKQRICLNRLDF